MFNKVIMLGNLTRDIELRYLPSGGAVATTGIATNRRFKKQDGSQSEEVCFIDISFFGRTAEIANQYLRKGSKVMVEGRLKLDTWQDQQGQKRSKHTVVVDTMQMVDTRGGADGGDMGGSYGDDEESYSQAPSQSNSQPPRQAAPSYQKRYNAPEQSGHKVPEIDINDDEIPF